MSTTRLTTFDLKRMQREERFRKQREELEKRQRQEQEKQKEITETMKHIVKQQLPHAVRDMDDRTKRAMHQLNENLRRIKELVRLYKVEKKLTPADKDQLLKLGEYFVSKQQEKHFFYQDVISGAIRDLRIHDFPVKFSSDYYHFLKKKMFPLDNVDTIIKSYSRHSQQGTAFEALWTMLISLGFCNVFTNEDYDFYNAELKELSSSTQYYFIESVMTTAEYLQFLRETPIRGPNGKSDITLRHKETGEWIFISCKYYQQEKGDYDISAIQRTIEETNRHHPGLIKKHKIYVFANNKEDAKIPIENKFKDDPTMKEIITTDGVYNILGIDDLKTCFEVFKEKKKGKTWTEFEKKYIKRYRKTDEQTLPSLTLRLDQDILVKRTYSIIYKKISKGQCSTRSTHSSHPSAHDNLRIYWETIPQFGKTYCVGRLIEKLLKIPIMFRTSNVIHSVIVVDNLEIARKYANEVLGAYNDFMDNFHVTIVKNRGKPVNLVDYLRLTPKQKVVHTLQKYKETNNILIVLKEDLELIRDLKNLFLIVFDVEDGTREFQEFGNSPHRIGLFLSDVPRHAHTDCDHVLTWSDHDAKSIQRIYLQSIQKPQQSISNLFQTKSFVEKKKEMFQQQESNRRTLVNATRQDLEKCVQSPIHIVSDFGSSSTRLPSLEKIQHTQQVIRAKKHNNRSFSTQFWFVKDREACFQWKEQLKQFSYFFEHFDIAIYGENQGTNRNPTPYKDLPGSLTRHNQKLALTMGKDTLIYLIPIDKARMLKGVSFPNVDTIFSLSDRMETDVKLLTYTMMSKCRTPKEGKTSMYFVDFNMDRVKSLIETCFQQDTVAGLIDVSNPDLTTEEIMARTQVGMMLQQMIRKVQQKSKEKIVDDQQQQEQKIKDPFQQMPKATRRSKSKKPMSLTSSQEQRVKSILKVIGSAERNKKNTTPSTKSYHRGKYDDHLKNITKSFDQLINSGISQKDFDLIRSNMNRKLGLHWDRSTKKWVTQQSKDQSKS